MTIVLIKKPRAFVLLPHAEREARNALGLWGDLVKRVDVNAHLRLEILTNKYTMAKKGRMTRRRKSQKKSMRKGTRKQQRGGDCTVSGGWCLSSPGGCCSGTCSNFKCN